MANPAKTEMRQLKPMDFVKDMGAGWNLGNAMDSIGPDETAWGNPRITKELIDAVAKRGFKTIRIPVTWRFHMGEAPDYAIEKAWMDRVEEVVNYALDNDVYVILNTHHENEWTTPSPDKVDAVTNQLNKVWTQIAIRFKDYGDHLIFEPLNETRIEGAPAEWIGGTPEERDCCNKFQQAAVDAIRATGGNNAVRMILVAPFGASNNPQALDALVVPNDDPNILISIHHYFPADFSLMNRADWGSSEDIRALKNSFDEIEDRFTSKGRAVVLGEWGSTNHDNPGDRLKHAKYFVREAAKRGMCPVWWDNGGENDFGLLNRRTLDWFYPEIADTILKETSTRH
jgi:endoglucanase